VAPCCVVASGGGTRQKDMWRRDWRLKKRGWVSGPSWAGGLK
jgi:hypothetical protein